MNQKQELKTRVEAKKKQLEADLAQAKADGSEAARKTQSQIETKLDELQEAIKDGWDNVTETVASKINSLLGDKSANN